MNKIQIMGNLGADPETRFTAGGKKVVSFRVATKSWKASKEETLWWRVTFWEERCPAIEKILTYMKKGSSVVISGELFPEVYEGKVSLNITGETLNFSPFGKPAAPEGSPSQPGQRNDASGSQEPFASQNPVAYGSAPSYGGHEANMMDDQVPF